MTIPLHPRTAAVMQAIAERQVIHPASLSPQGLGRAAVDPVTLSVFLSNELAPFQVLATSLGQGFSWSKAKQAAAVITEAVRLGLPLVQGADAVAVIEGLVSYVWATFAAPALPLYLKPFAPLILMCLINTVDGLWARLTASAPSSSAN